MQAIKCEILKPKIIIQNEIINNPTVSVSKLSEKMILDLTFNYGEQAVASYCSQFDFVESGFMNKKSKLVPKLPESLEEFEFNRTYTSKN